MGKSRKRRRSRRANKLLPFLLVGGAFVVAAGLAGWALAPTLAPEAPIATSKYTPEVETPGTHPTRVVLVGDSHLGSGKDYDGFDGGMGYQAGLLMGWDMVAHLGQGGTGYVNAPEGRTTYGQRLADIVAAKPEMVYIQGGNNDYADKIGPAATKFYDELKAAIPGVILVVAGPVITSDPVVERGDIRLRDNLKAAALAAGAYYIDPVAEQWIKGPERSTERADAKYIGPDGVHLNIDGVHYMAGKLHAALVAAGVPSETPDS